MNKVETILDGVASHLLTEFQTQSAQIKHRSSKGIVRR